MKFGIHQCEILGTSSVLVNNIKNSPFVSESGTVGESGTLSEGKTATSFNWQHDSALGKISSLRWADKRT